MPWVMHWPERWREPGTVGGLRHHLDLVPTILGLLGLSWEGELPGRDLFSTAGHERVLSSCWYDSVCLSERSGDRKVVYSPRSADLEQNLAALAELAGFRFEIENRAGGQLVVIRKG